MSPLSPAFSPPPLPLKVLSEVTAPHVRRAQDGLWPTVVHVTALCTPQLVLQGGTRCCGGGGGESGHGGWGVSDAIDWVPAQSISVSRTYSNYPHVAVLQFLSSPDSDIRISCYRLLCTWENNANCRPWNMDAGTVKIGWLVHHLCRYSRYII